MPLTTASTLRHRLDKIGANPWAVAALLATALVVTALVLVTHCSLAPLDMEIYRFGAQALIDGHDPYGPLPRTNGGVTLPFIYPPFAAMAFVVLAVPPLPVAAALTHGASLAALGTTIYVVVRPHAARRTAVLTAVLLGTAALALEPVRETLWFGQINLVLMALVVLDCLGPKTRLPRGALLGLAAAVKLTPAGFLLFFLLKKDFRAAATTVVTFFAAALAGFAVAPQASWQYWFGGEMTGASGMSGSIFATNQSIQGAANRLGLSGALIAIATLAALALAVTAMRRADKPIAFLLNAALILVCSPISWSHHWVWIVPALILLGFRGFPAAAVVTAVFIWAPHSHLPTGDSKELQWQPWQHLAGNTYLLLALGFLGWWCVRSFVDLRRTGPPRPGAMSCAPSRNRPGLRR